MAKVTINSLELSLSIIAVAAVGLASLRMKIIVDRAGFIAAMFVGSSIMIFGGTRWFVILLAFYSTAAYFTKYKYERKMKIEAAEPKGGARGWQNVLSNGATASTLAICYGLTSHKIFAAAYLGAISTSIADTLATEIGLLNPSEPRLLTNPRVKVKAGISGGVTLLGEAAGLLGTFVTALVTLIVGFEGLSVIQVLVFNLLVGFLGCNFDSLLGATVQAAFKCQVCGKITEGKAHCGRPTKHFKGIRLIDNNVVNFASTIFGALVAMFFFPYIS